MGVTETDYFMFVNSYSRVRDIKKFIQGDDIVVQVLLENDAYLS